MVTTKDFIKLYAENMSKQGVELKPSEAKIAVDTFLSAIDSVILSGEKLMFRGAFSLEAVERKGREAVNPRTGEKMSVPASYSLKVTTGKILKEKLNKEF